MKLVLFFFSSNKLQLYTTTIDVKSVDFNSVKAKDTYGRIREGSL